MPESEAIWNKIVDFLGFASFLASLIFFGTVSTKIFNLAKTLPNQSFRPI